MTSKPFHTIPSLNLSTFTTDDLEKLSSAGRYFNIDRIRFTPGGQLAVSGVAEEDLPELTALLGEFMHSMPDNGIGTIFACPGCNDCKHGLRDTSEIASKIQNLDLPLPLPAKVKIAVAGCTRCCTMPRLRDIGLIPAGGDAGEWHLYFGGNGGSKPRISDCIGENLSPDETLKYIRISLSIYQQCAKPGIRTSRFIETTGFESFRKKLEKKLTS
jgi:NAD(P)H-nitrite reductase large subunit